MRIAQIAPIPESIPPKKYGGTERVVYYLTEELVKMGHEVTLFASGDSKTSAQLFSVVPKALREMKDAKDIYGFNSHTMLNMGMAYAMQDRFDVIHDHSPHMGVPTANIARTPVVMTWHGPYEKDINNLFANLNRPYLTSISKAQAARVPVKLNFIGNVYHGLPLKEYPFSDKHKNYLLFVGRIDREKGVHHSIDAAVRLKKKMIIAAKYDSQVPTIREYFETEIKPRLEKHKNLVQWVGEVDENERNELMMNAECMLHAVTWPEPFGLTLIEAMACGCPVIAFNNGSIPEIIYHGKTGFIVENTDGMVEAIRNISTISRSYCREYAVSRFTTRRMAEGYLECYKKAILLAKLRDKKAVYGPESKRQNLFLGYGASNA